MNPADVAPIARYAARQLENKRVGCILQAKQVAELTDAYADALRRLAAIAAVVDRVWCPFCDNNIEATRQALHEIERLAGM